jgi:serine/threonine-protein kinase
MITAYINIYLVFIILLALLLLLLAVKTGLPSPRTLIFFIIMLLVVPMIGGYFYLSYFNPIPELIVPKATGLPFELARERLEAVGLRARLAGSVYEMKYQEGSVISQKPEEGRKVKLGRTISLMVSSGKRRVSVPNLLGRNLSQAEAVINAAELSIGEIKRENNPELPEGTILAQEPLPGEEVEINSRVDLLLSSLSESQPATDEVE